MVSKINYDKMWYFQYNNPKTPRLPIWDKRPLTVPLYLTKKHALMINVHWIKPIHRYKFMVWFIKLNKQVKDRKKIARITYEMIKNNLPYAMPGIRKYMQNRIRSPIGIPNKEITRLTLLKPKYYAQKETQVRLEKIRLKKYLKKQKARNKKYYSKK